MSESEWHGLWSARVEHLLDGRHVGVICWECGHVAEVPCITIKERVHPNVRVQKLHYHLRCGRCDAKGKLRLIVGHALGRGLSPSTSVP